MLFDILIEIWIFIVSQAIFSAYDTSVFPLSSNRVACIVLAVVICVLLYYSYKYLLTSIAVFLYVPTTAAWFHTVLTANKGQISVQTYVIAWIIAFAVFAIFYAKEHASDCIKGGFTSRNFVRQICCALFFNYFTTQFNVLLFPDKVQKAAALVHNKGQILIWIIAIVVTVIESLIAYAAAKRSY